MTIAHASNVIPYRNSLPRRRSVGNGLLVGLMILFGGWIQLHSREPSFVDPLADSTEAEIVTQIQAILEGVYPAMDSKDRAAWEEGCESLLLAIEEPSQGRQRLLLPAYSSTSTTNAQRFAKAMELSGKRIEIEALLSSLSQEYLRQAVALEFQGESERSYRLRWRAAAIDWVLPKTRDRKRDSLAVTWSHASDLGKSNVVPKSLEAYPSIGWPAGSYATVITPHFEIASQAGADHSSELATLFELTYAVWHQLFYHYWANKQIVAPEYATGSIDRMSVVLFRDKAAYVKKLKEIEPNIAVSTGYYNPGHRTSYFYWDGNKTTSTMVHELVHQLFFEASGGTVELNTDRDPGFWVVEGIALYMESISTRTCGGALIVEVGGWDAARLQPGRYRRLHDQFWIPWEDFHRATGSQFRKGNDLSAWYSQACGLTHLWMDGDAAKRRELCEYLASIYAGKEAWERLTEGTDDETVRTAYDRYLMQSPLLATSPRKGIDRPYFSNRKEAILTRCPVTSANLLQWKPAYRNASRLELSFTKVDDALFDPPTGDPWNVAQLSLESTSVTDASMQAIASMKNLVELDLSGCAITDEGVAALQNHRSLKSLWLTGTHVTDASLDSLRTIDSLEMVNTAHTRVTPAAWLKFLKDRPKLKSKSSNS